MITPEQRARRRRYWKEAAFSIGFILACLLVGLLMNWLESFT